MLEYYNCIFESTIFSTRPRSFVEYSCRPQLNEQAIIPEIQVNEEREMSDDTHGSMEPSDVSEDYDQDMN